MQEPCDFMQYSILQDKKIYDLKKTMDQTMKYIVTLYGSLSVRNSMPGISRNQTGKPLHRCKTKGQINKQHE